MPNAEHLKGKEFTCFQGNRIVGGTAQVLFLKTLYE